MKRHSLNIQIDNLTVEQAELLTTWFNTFTALIGPPIPWHADGGNHFQPEISITKEIKGLVGANNE